MLHPNMHRTPWHGEHVFSATLPLISIDLIQSTCAETLAYTPGRFGLPQPIPHETTPTTTSFSSMVKVRGPPLLPWQEWMPSSVWPAHIMLSVRMKWKISERAASQTCCGRANRCDTAPAVDSPLPSPPAPTVDSNQCTSNYNFTK